MERLKESDLYPPLKSFLTGQGYEVKAEVGACDIMACRDDAGPVIVEMKTRPNLGLVLQGIDRQAVTDAVYVALPAQSVSGRPGRRFRKLCRMLGLGLLLVHLKAESSWVEALLDPGPYKPRKDKRRQTRLLREYQQRVGDPNVGGTNGARMTVYRQHALRCAGHLARSGTAKVGDLRASTGVDRAATILQRDVYGWFERESRGIYRLSPRGEAAVESYAAVLADLDAAAEPRRVADDA